MTTTTQTPSAQTSREPPPAKPYALPLRKMATIGIQDAEGKPVTLAVTIAHAEELVRAVNAEAGLREALDEIRQSAETLRDLCHNPRTPQVQMFNGASVIESMAVAALEGGAR